MQRRVALLKKITGDDRYPVTYTLRGWVAGEWSTLVETRSQDSASAEKGAYNELLDYAFDFLTKSDFQGALTPEEARLSLEHLRITAA